MATRFGGQNAAHRYKIQQLYLVGGAITVAVVALLFVLMSGSGNSTVDPQPATAAVQSTPSAPPEEVLVANVRVEQYQLLDDSMLGVETMPADRIPVGAAKSADRPSVVGRYTSEAVNPQAPILLSKLTTSPPLSSLPIPPGHRAVTITVDRVTGVEGWAKPNSRVDILWTYRDKDGSTKVATIVHFVKILSVGGQVGGDQPAANVQGVTPVTVLVTEKDAKKVELARNLGTLTLSLVGDKDTSNPVAKDGAESISFEDLVGVPTEVEQKDESYDGVMYVTDPKTGRNSRYCLRNNKWSVCDDGGKEERKSHID